MGTLRPVFVKLAVRMASRVSGSSASSSGEHASPSGAHNVFAWAKGFGSRQARRGASRVQGDSVLQTVPTDFIVTTVRIEEADRPVSDSADAAKRSKDQV